MDLVKIREKEALQDVPYAGNCLPIVVLGCVEASASRYMVHVPLY